MTFTLDEIERILERESQYIQRCHLRYYLDGMHALPQRHERDWYTEGVARGLEKAAEFLKEEALARTARLS